MTNRCLPAAVLAAIAAAACGPAWAATTPKPSVPPHATAIPVPHFPNEKLHTEYTVEVNKKGQVVRVKSSKQCKYANFNVQTYGNALQMWIRRPDGTAQVGLYRVTYDYDPKTKHIARNESLVSAGGNWADAEGAANVMLDTAKKEAADEQKKQREDAAKLPTLKQIRGVTPTPSASPSATLPP